MPELETNRPLVVMISSTARDLPEYRQAVMDACQRQGMVPKMMEHLPPLGEDAITASLALVDESDIYLGIFAHRYGYVPAGHEKSITEMEYERSVSRAIPRLLFVMNEDHPVPPTHVERGKGAEKLESLKLRINTDRVRAVFTTPDNLHSLVTSSLVEFRKRREPKPPGPFDFVGVDRVIEEKLERTRLVVDCLQKLAAMEAQELVVLNQAAFTIIAASDDPQYGPAGGHTVPEMQLLLEERRAFEKLVEAPNVTLKLLLWPKQRSYKRTYLELRFKTLLDWMRRTQKNPRVEFACADIPVPNRLIVVGQFCIEGSKYHFTPNYDVTAVKTQQHEVNHLAKEFFTTFGRSFRGNESTIAEVQGIWEGLRHESLSC